MSPLSPPEKGYLFYSSLIRLGSVMLDFDLILEKLKGGDNNSINQVSYCTLETFEGCNLEYLCRMLCAYLASCF